MNKHLRENGMNLTFCKKDLNNLQRDGRGLFKGGRGEDVQYLISCDFSGTEWNDVSSVTAEQM